MAQFDVTAPRSHQAGVVRLPRQPGRGWLVGGVTIAAALLLWYVLTSLTGIISSYRLPSPPEFLAALRQIAVDGYASGTLLQQTLQSLKIVIEGFLVASLVGIPLGFLMGWSRRVEARKPSIGLNSCSSWARSASLSLFSKGVWLVRSDWRLGRSCRAGRRGVSFARPDVRCRLSGKNGGAAQSRS